MSTTLTGIRGARGRRRLVRAVPRARSGSARCGVREIRRHKVQKAGGDRASFRVDIIRTGRASPRRARGGPLRGLDHRRREQGVNPLAAPARRLMDRSDARRRVVVEGVQPEIDCGRFAIKRITGDRVTVEADVFADGHDALTSVLAWRREASGTGGTWSEVPMEALGNDRWRATFTVEEQGRYRYTVRGWIDRFGSWTRDLRKKIDAGQDVTIDLAVGAELAGAAAKRTTGPDAQALLGWGERLRVPDGPDERDPEMAFDEDLAALMAANPDTTLPGVYPRALSVLVDRPRARFRAR